MKYKNKDYFNKNLGFLIFINQENTETTSAKTFLLFKFQKSLILCSMEIWLLFGTLLLFFSFLPLGLKKVWRTSQQPKKWINYTVNALAVMLFLALFIEFILSLNNQYFTGYKTRTFLVISATLFLTLHYLIAEFKSKFYKVFVELLLVITIFVTTSISIVNLSNYNEFYLFENEQYRIERNWVLSGGNFNLPKLYKKHGIIETAYQLEYDSGYEYDYFHEITKEAISDYEFIETDSSIRVICIFEDQTVSMLSISE